MRIDALEKEDRIRRALADAKETRLRVLRGRLNPDLWKRDIEELEAAPYFSLTPGMLAEVTGLTPGSVAAALSRLQRRCKVTRVQERRGARPSRYTLTTLAERGERAEREEREARLLAEFGGLEAAQDEVARVLAEVRSRLDRTRLPENATEASRLLSRLRRAAHILG